jgi:hypothetical protein
VQKIVQFSHVMEQKQLVHVNRVTYFKITVPAIIKVWGRTCKFLSHCKISVSASSKVVLLSRQPLYRPESVWWLQLIVKVPCAPFVHCFQMFLVAMYDDLGTFNSFGEVGVSEDAGELENSVFHWIKS